MAVSLEKRVQELQDLLYRKTGPQTVGISGQTIVRNSITNITVNPKSRTYDAIVDSGGGADFRTIEAAVEYTNSIGGGDIFIWGGTYYPTSTISITKPTNIVGQSASLVTVNFAGSANNFTVSSANQYTTGTITAASGTAITGSGTSWSTNVVAGYHLFLGTRWYKIASVTDDTHLVLAEAYYDNVTLPASYRIANIPTDVSFETLLIVASTGTAIAVTDCKGFFALGTVIASCNKGITLTNVSLYIIQGAVVLGSTSNSVEFTNCGVCTINGLQANGSGGVGWVLNNITEFSAVACEIVSPTGNGISITSTSRLKIQVKVRGAGAIGIEAISGNRELDFSGSTVTGSTSDNIKLTATSDYCKIIGCHIGTAGGYGVNVAAATCDKNVIVGNTFDTNTSGNTNDAGTGTVIANNTT